MLISFLKNIFTFRWLQIRNYLFRRLDTATRIEIILFVLFFVVYFFHSVNANLGRILAHHNIRAAFDFYRMIVNLLLLCTLTAAYGMGKNIFKDKRNLFLLSQPVPYAAQAHAMILNSLLPIVPGLIVLFGVQLLFTIKSQAHGAIYLLFILHLLEIFLLSFIGLGMALLMTAHVKRKVILSASIPLALIPPIVVQLKLTLDGNIFYSWTGILAIIMVGAFSYFVLYKTLHHSLQQNAAIFTIRSSPKVRLRKFHSLWTFYLSLAPGKFHPYILKDTTFAFRRYKSFLFNVLFLILVVMTGAVLIARNGHNAVQWIFFVSIISGYIMANKAFSFYGSEAESLALIKTMPVSAKEYWWGKFWVSFLPVLWLTTVGHLFILCFLPSMLYWLGSLCLAVLINFTLIFIQNNFALYSYPYTRYSILWYNLYVITAVLFFTILLFPPLSIVFLIFGFLSIFRVQNRISQWEIA